ncbi:MAG TPA: universal stress protein [Candidatus Sulfomarinibacteraceae bacterium]|nr:universal stress protein [Candidatus Sulfomarinibacteraceae bacterium]
MTEESTNNREPEIVIRRILVALDTSTHSLAALEAAARLAVAMEAELVGLFVEDINLLRLAALPFAREICWPSTAGRQLDERKMERDLRLRASQARRALALTAEKVEVQWTFRVVRGAVTDEVLSAAADADLISLGRASRSLTARVRLGSTARAAAVKGERSVLLAREGADLEQPLVVTYDGSSSAGRALAAAARLAQPNDTNLIVLIMADDPDEAPRLAEEASDWLERRVVHAEYRYLPPDDGSNLIEALYRERCGLLVLGGELQLLKGDMLGRILDELDCPILLVR